MTTNKQEDDDSPFEFKDVDSCLNSIGGDMYFDDLEVVMENWMKFAEDRTKAKLFLERMETLKKLYHDEVFKEFEMIFNSDEIIKMANAKCTAEH